MSDTVSRMTDAIYRDAQTVWDYMKLAQAIHDAPVLLALGSRDERVAEYAVDVLRSHSYNHVILCGGASTPNPC